MENRMGEMECALADMKMNAAFYDATKLPNFLWMCNEAFLKYRELWLVGERPSPKVENSK